MNWKKIETAIRRKETEKIRLEAEIRDIEDAIRRAKALPEVIPGKPNLRAKAIRFHEYELREALEELAKLK